MDESWLRAWFGSETADVEMWDEFLPVAKLVVELHGHRGKAAVACMLRGVLWQLTYPDDVLTTAQDYHDAVSEAQKALNHLYGVIVAANAVGGVPQRALQRETGLALNTVRRALGKRE